MATFPLFRPAVLRPLLMRWQPSPQQRPRADQDETDPLSHPDIARMSPRELADLPFPRPRR